MRQAEFMDLFRQFRIWQDKFALTFVGCVLGAVGIAFGLYFSLQKTTPNLRFEEVTRANVIDVKEDVGKLEILFNGVNLRTNHQTLALVTLKVANDGAAPIRISDYDPSVPFGIEISGGEIAKAERLPPKSKYFQSRLTISASATNVIISPVVIEAGDAFSIKLLVLHNEKTTFAITPIGKIAGIRDIAYINLSLKEAPPSFWKRAFGGDLPSQVARLVGYTVQFVIIVVPLLTVVGLIESWYEKAIRRRKVATFRQTRASTLKPEHAWLLESYIENGDWIIMETMDMLQKPKGDSKSLKGHIFISDTGPKERCNLRKHLKDCKAVTTNGEELVVDKDFQAFVSDVFTSMNCARALKRPHEFYGDLAREDINPSELGHP